MEIRNWKSGGNENLSCRICCGIRPQTLQQVWVTINHQQLTINQLFILALYSNILQILQRIPWVASMCPFQRRRSSVVEHVIGNDGVGGPIPLGGTTLHPYGLRVAQPRINVKLRMNPTKA